MANRLIECVPNFSEGRDLAKVAAILTAIGSAPGALVLDCTSDPDHNRSVITFAAPPDAVVEAAVRGAGKAAELIDLNHHSGVHPRIGAVDVIPFVPLEGVSMEACTFAAEHTGREIWNRFGIPVYLYEAAARQRECVDLAAVRRGEGVAPDFGTGVHPTAGAVAVGARKFLIAFNVNLDTADVAVARRIARAVRFSSGGLPAVKAMGVLLESRNQAQVSMNLTDFEVTPIRAVFDLVRAKAAEHGARIVGSELIGLIPQRAIEATTPQALMLDGFRPGWILENRLAAALASSVRQ